MTPDGTNSFSTADEGTRSQRGTNVTEPNCTVGPEEEVHHVGNTESWSYLFVHHSKVESFEQQLVKDNVTCFVHKTVRYFKKKAKGNVQRREVPTVSGLVFIQGSPKQISAYLSKNFPYTHLCKSCATGKVAEIPDSQMRPFMRISKIMPERIRFLLHPFHYYANNHILLRVTSGELAGLEGYVIRIDRDRRLVMDVGGISVAISGVHAEKFEEVEQKGSSNQYGGKPCKRNLKEREALIDRYFHPVVSEKDIVAQAESIDYLREYVLAEHAKGRMTVNEVWTSLFFIIEEIGYYYASVAERLKERLNPIMQMGGKVFLEMESVVNNPSLDDDTKERYAANRQELAIKYGYLLMY